MKTRKERLDYSYDTTLGLIKNLKTVVDAKADVYPEIYIYGLKLDLPADVALDCLNGIEQQLRNTINFENRFLEGEPIKQNPILTVNTLTDSETIRDRVEKGLLKD